MIRFTLPWAPSLNHAYPTVRSRGKSRRVKSKALLAYREACGTHVLASSIPRFQYLNGERLAVWIFCRPPTSRAFDLDNRVKAVLDVLQYCGVIGNDGQVDELHIERGSMDAPLGHLVVQLGERSAPGVIEVVGNSVIVNTDQRGVAASQLLPLKEFNRETGRTGPAPGGCRVESRARALSGVAVDRGREPRGDG